MSTGSRSARQGDFVFKFSLRSLHTSMTSTSANCSRTTLHLLVKICFWDDFSNNYNVLLKAIVSHRYLAHLTVPEAKQNTVPALITGTV